MESINTFEYRTPSVEWGSYDDEYDELEEPIFLENPWTIWYDQYPGPGLTAQQYAAAMKKVATIESVQDFWGIFNNLPALEEIHTKSSYHLMKNVTLPLWEDNEDGGSLTFRIKKTDSQHVWLYMVLAVIGEQFDDVLTPGDAIQGISVNVRAGTEDAVTLWNKRADLINVSKFQEKIKKLLFGVDFLSEVTYRVHRAELTFNSGSSSHKSHKSKKGHSSPPRGNSPPKKSPRGASPPKHNNYTPKAKSPKKPPHPHSAAKSTFIKNLTYVYVPISV